MVQEMTSVGLQPVDSTGEVSPDPTRTVESLGAYQRPISASISIEPGTEIRVNPVQDDHWQVWFGPSCVSIDRDTAGRLAGVLIQAEAQQEPWL